MFEIFFSLLRILVNSEIQYMFRDVFPTCRQYSPKAMLQKFFITACSGMTNKESSFSYVKHRSYLHVKYEAQLYTVSILFNNFTAGSLQIFS